MPPMMQRLLTAMKSHAADCLTEPLQERDLTGTGGGSKVISEN